MTEKAQCAAGGLEQRGSSQLSTANLQTVGAYVYRVLVKKKIPLNKVHLIGQGLGAHAAA